MFFIFPTTPSLFRYGTKKSGLCIGCLRDALVLTSNDFKDNCQNIASIYPNSISTKINISIPSTNNFRTGQTWTKDYFIGTIDATGKLTSVTPSIQLLIFKQMLLV